MDWHKSLEILSVLFVLVLIFSPISPEKSKRKYDESDIKIRKLDGIFVDHGRSVFLTKNNLRISHRLDGVCKVTVLQNNPEIPRTGSLEPSSFSCDFQPNVVYYQHFGSKNRKVEVLNLQARLDTINSTHLVNFILSINVRLYKPFEVLKNIESLFVNEMGGFSEPLSPNVISFYYNKEKQKCKVRFLPRSNGPPYYGSLVNASIPGKGLTLLNYKEISCSDFINGNVRYVHRRSKYSSNRDYLPLVIEIFDKTTTAIEKKEYVHVPVRIRRAPENQRPIVNYNVASYSMQVDQLVLTALTRAIVRVEDRETDPGAITFNITQKYKDTEGFLIHTDDPSTPIRFFYQKDIEDLKIAFKAPDILSTTQRMQQIWMEAKDSYGANSDPFYIIVVIKPTNSRAPQVLRNDKLTMFEGQSRVINTEILKIRDPDNESVVVISVKSGLKNGRLEKDGKRASKFSIEDLQSGDIRYVHDDSDTTSDNIIFKISDGENTLDILFLILIISQDDQPPQLKYNTGLNINEGDLKMIDQFCLSATDVDSEDTRISYKIETPPKAGNLVLRQREKPENLRGWKYTSNGVYEKQISEFYQTDIILGNVFYRHLDNEIFYDTFTFHISDEIPNQSELKTFIIDVNSIDDLSPVLSNGCNLTLNVEKGKHAFFSKESLSYTDGDSLDTTLVYRITKEPYFIDSNSTPPAGMIVSSHNVSQKIFKFTQKFVNHFKVRYVPLLTDSQEKNQKLNNSRNTVLFEFSVEDPSGNIVPNQTFTINILESKDKPPSFVTSVIIIPQGENKTITLKNLNARNDNNNTADISFILRKQARHGVITFKGAKLTPGGVVSLSDIKKGFLEYLHSGLYGEKDDAQFILSDKTHMVPATLAIEIIPTRTKVITVRLLQKQLTVQENGVSEITSDVLEVTRDGGENGGDEESPYIYFKINNEPKHGVIEKKGAHVDTFTWRDIINGQLAYRHTSGEIGVADITDQFMFQLGNTSKDIVVKNKLVNGFKVVVTIRAVDSQPPKLSVPMRVEVDEGDKAALNINITDKDTSLNEVYCRITSEPKYGFIIDLTPKRGSEIKPKSTVTANFTAESVSRRQVEYVQSRYQRIEPKADQFKLRCTDGNNSSPEVTINIQIRPVNDEAPILFVQNPITCLEDDLVLFDLSKINPFDRDIPRDILKISVMKQPNNGELMLQKSTGLQLATVFSYEELSGRTDTTLMYQHKGTETFKDEFVLNVSDGVHSVNKTININIIPMDDERPQLVVNIGLQIDRGETKIITSKNLKAEDIDSINSNLMYIVMMESILGKLQKQTAPNVYVNLQRGSNFTQNDIDDRRIRYVHLNLKGSEEDSVRLDVTDGTNRLINQVFYILIKPEDTIIPTVINKDLKISENSRKVLTTDILSASDINTPNEDLQFVVTKLPMRGYLEHSDYHGIPLTRFSQLDLASNKISYIHKSLDEVDNDNFEFEVTDGTNKVFRTFKIQILSVDNKKPFLNVSTIKVYERQMKVITPFELSAKDNDTVAEKLVFQIHRKPKFGEILLNGETKTSRFTQKDIDLNRVSYKNKKTPKKHLDFFTVTVTDGTHGKFFHPFGILRTSPVMVELRIKELDTEVPIMLTNKGSSFLHHRHGRTFFRFSISNLEAIDSHSTPEQIVYKVRTLPVEGKIINVKNKQKQITTFTQQDVNERLIEYVLNKDSNGTNDVFLFDVQDKNKNILRQQSFYLHWARVCTGEYYKKVQESDGILSLYFNRIGNLQNVGFAKVAIRDIQGVKGVEENEKILHWRAGDKIANVNLTLIDNSEYDKVKKLIVSLKDCVNVVVGPYCNMQVEIEDPEDESIVYLPKSSLSVEEAVGTLDIPLRRTRDLNDVTSVYCFTRSGSAQGTIGNTVTSFNDFISREADKKKNLVTFEKNESLKFCSIKIIDDTTFEANETFEVYLISNFGGKIDSDRHTTLVTIESDKKDVPVFMMESDEYTVLENGDAVRITVHRSTQDPDVYSYVQVVTQQSFPVSAQANKDYRAMVKLLEFAPGVAAQHVDIKIIDDVMKPRLEGRETFVVTLQNARNARIDEKKSKTVVTIDDSEIDQPVIFFDKTSYRVSENSKTISIPIHREGDILQTSSFRCFTRQHSARAAQDFEERPRNEDSIVKFERREKLKDCKVMLMDDKKFEEDESFRIFLEISPEDTITTIRGTNSTLITIVDDDVPTVSFVKHKYFAYEPTQAEKQSSVQVILQRTGDLSKYSTVSVISRDGSAISRVHYEPVVKTVNFLPQASEMPINVTLYHSNDVNLRVAFSLFMTADVDDPVTKITNQRTVISVEERSDFGTSTFPLNPIIVSLIDYDDIKAARKHPVNGYPLICVTACDPKYPYYEKTKALCAQEKIVNEKTTFRWQIEKTNAEKYYENINQPIFFARTDGMALDSIYFSASSRIRCVAKAYSTSGGSGLESTSDTVSISSSRGICSKAGSSQNMQYSAQVSYIKKGSSNKEFNNMVQVKVLIPHYDGSLPVISTKRLTNDVENLLRPGNINRIYNHPCSNLLNLKEITTKFGFVSTHPEGNVYKSHPYVFDATLRGNDTVRFYKHLNLDSCLWTFESYYTINELVSKCGAEMITNDEIQYTVQSSFAVNIPLFISYLYKANQPNSLTKGSRSNNFVRKNSQSDSLDHIGSQSNFFMQYNYQSSLHLTAVYDTGALWDNGIKTAGGKLSGELFPSSILIMKKDRRLLFKFKTKAHFKGVFILQTKEGRFKSTVTSSDHPALSFKLTHAASEETYDEPTQEWEMTSDMAVRDYSGTYLFSMIPCVVEKEVNSFSWPPVLCEPNEAVLFELPLSIHQTSQPVEASFRLNTLFVILNDRTQYLSPRIQSNELINNDVSFEEGDTIYGRVLTENLSSRSNTHRVRLDKVYICAGKDGFLPEFSPNEKNYGCLVESNGLMYRLKVLDRSSPETQDSEFWNSPFNASFLNNDVRADNSDGFSLSSTPLFKGNTGRTWFVHVIYKVRSKKRKTNGRAKRDVEETLIHDFSSFNNNRGKRSLVSDSSILGNIDNLNTQRNVNKRDKRSLNGKIEVGKKMRKGKMLKRKDNRDIRSIGNKKGTNIKMLQLVSVSGGHLMIIDSHKNKRDKSSTFPYKILGPVLGVSLLVLLAVVLVVYKIRKRKTESSQKDL